MSRIALPGSDFIIPPEPKQQALGMFFGHAGHGKTTAALMSPGPIAYIDIDRRGLGAIQYAQRVLKKKVMYLPIGMPRRLSKKPSEQVKAESQKQWDIFTRNYELALKASLKGDVRTIVIDTATELWTLQLLAKHGRTDKIIQRNWEIPKAEFSELIKSSRDTNANLICLARAKAEYIDDKPTGMMRPDGMKELLFEVDWAAQIRLVQPSKRDRTKFRFETETTKAGYSTKDLGQVYTSDDWDPYGPFVWLSMQQFVGTTPEDWE